MGFFRKRLERTVLVHPRELGPGLTERVKAQAAAEASASAVTAFGHVVTTMRIPDDFVVSGPIDHLTGAVRFSVTLDAICFKPLKHEVLDAVVQTCSSQGFWAEAGPFVVMVHAMHMGDLEFRAEDMAWVSPDSGLAVKAASAVRLKIMGVNPAARQISGIGTINEPFLGLLG